eukprot:7278759-Lingulodinium_polyedra.AAC.1
MEPHPEVSLDPENRADPDLVLQDAPPGNVAEPSEILKPVPPMHATPLETAMRRDPEQLDVGNNTY